MDHFPSNLTILKQCCRFCIFIFLYKENILFNFCCWFVFYIFVFNILTIKYLFLMAASIHKLKMPHSKNLFVCFFLAFKYKIKFLNQNASLMIKVWSQLELGLQIKYCKHVFLYDFFGFFNNKYNIIWGGWENQLLSQITIRNWILAKLHGARK